GPRFCVGSALRRECGDPLILRYVDRAAVQVGEEVLLRQPVERAFAKTLAEAGVLLDLAGPHAASGIVHRRIGGRCWKHERKSVDQRDKYRLMDKVDGETMA